MRIPLFSFHPKVIRYLILKCTMPKIGIFKFDILSQRRLVTMKETVRHVKRNRGVDVNDSPVP